MQHSWGSTSCDHNVCLVHTFFVVNVSDVHRTTKINTNRFKCRSATDSELRQIACSRRWVGVVNRGFLCHFPEYFRGKYEHKKRPLYSRRAGRLSGFRLRGRSQERKVIRESVRRLSLLEWILYSFFKSFWFLFKIPFIRFFGSKTSS